MILSQVDEGYIQAVLDNNERPGFTKRIHFTRKHHVKNHSPLGEDDDATFHVIIGRVRYVPIDEVGISTLTGYNEVTEPKGQAA
jgi:hypothetical protein